jgi:hypothetical protein
VERTYEIRKIPLWPAVRLMFVLFLVVGILIAIIYSIIFSGLSFLANTLGESPFGNDMEMFQRLGLVMIPIIAVSYAFFGTLVVIIWVLVYNLIASVVGGIELDLKTKGDGGIRPQRMNEGEGEYRQAPN